MIIPVYVNGEGEVVTAQERKDINTERATDLSEDTSEKMEWLNQNCSAEDFFGLTEKDFVRFVRLYQRPLA